MRMWKSRPAAVVWNWALSIAYFSLSTHLARESLASGSASAWPLIGAFVCFAFGVWSFFTYGAPGTWQSIRNIDGAPYLERFYLAPKNPFCLPLIHLWMGSDYRQATHCHPAASWSILLWGSLREFVLSPDRAEERPRVLRPFAMTYRRADFAHRIERIGIGFPPVTLFVFFAKTRQWGFWCGRGGARRWTHWKRVVDGGGCGDA